LWNERRAAIAKLYTSAFNEINGIMIPYVSADIEPVWHLYVIKTKQRELMQRQLQKNGVNTLIHYPVPPHLSKAYSSLGYALGDFPITEVLANQVLSLPIGPHMSTEEILYCISCIKNGTTEV